MYPPSKMDESEGKKFDNKYLEIALMLCYFLIPFYGLQRTLKNYLQEPDLSFGYILLLMFIGGNIMTCMIFILNDKSLKTKAIWTGGLLLSVLILNFIVR
jgi:hypothetical protein